MSLLRIWIAVMLCWNCAAGQKTEERSIILTSVCPFPIKGKSTYYVPATPLPENAEEYTGKWVEMKLNRFSPLGPYKVKVRKHLQLFRRPDPSQKPIVKLKASDLSDRALLFFVGNKTSRNYEVLATADDGVKKGSFYILNKTKFPLGFEIGEVKKVVQPGKAGTITPGDGGKDAKVYIRRDGTELLRSTRWFIRKDQREFVVFLGDPLRWVHVVDSRKVVSE